MMDLETARKLGLALFKAGLTPWLAEWQDGYMIKVLIEGEICCVFPTLGEKN